MTEAQTSKVAFALVRISIDGQVLLLMRRNAKWNDVGFIGGHETEKDSGSPERAARRELLEEVPVLRQFREFDLKAIAEGVTYGPVFSKSAKRSVVYKLDFFLVQFHRIPLPLFGAFGPRSPNVLVPEESLFGEGNIKVAQLVKVLDDRLQGGLRSLPLSWDEDLGASIHAAGSPYDRQFRLGLK